MLLPLNPSQSTAHSRCSVTTSGFVSQRAGVRFCLNCLSSGAEVPYQSSVRPCVSQKVDQWESELTSGL